MSDSLLTCLRCGHRWVPVVAHRPVTCAKCKARRWDVPRSRGRAAVAVAADYPTSAEVQAMIVEAIAAALPEIERRIIAALRSGHTTGASGRRPSIDSAGRTLDYEAF